MMPGGQDTAVGLLQVLLLSMAVFMFSQLGVWFGTLSGGESLVQPAAGLGFAACLIVGLPRALPAIYIGTALSNAISGASPWQANAGSLAMLAGVLVGSWLFERVFKGDAALGTMMDFFKFALAGCGVAAGVTAVLDTTSRLFSGVIPNVLFAGTLVDSFQGLALGIMVFGTVGLFVFRRQDLRPPTLRGSYELLFYSALLAYCLYILLTDFQLETLGVVLLVAACSLLVLLVSLRFGLRPASLYLATFVLLIPAFTVMFPQRVVLEQFVYKLQRLMNEPGLLALLGTLGCLLLAALRDELVALRVKFDLAMDSADMCVWEWSQTGWNFRTEEWCKKFGMPFSRALSEQAMGDFLHPDDRPGFVESFGKLQEGAATQWEYTYRLRDGSSRWVWVQSRAKPLRKTADDDVAVIAGITRDVTEERNSLQSKIAAVQNEAELKTLRSQLNPHFLFNSLNSVRALIGRDDARARTMVTALSKLLRDLLSTRGDKAHSLKRELEIASTYLEIESIRFGARLAYEIDSDPSADDRLVPGMMIQTLVENAVKHGISQREQGGKILIRVRIAPGDNALHISVLNDGALGGPSGGVGVENTRRRIALATSGQGTLSLIQLPGPKVEATIVLPQASSEGDKDADNLTESTQST